MDHKPKRTVGRPKGSTARRLESFTMEEVFKKGYQAREKEKNYAQGFTQSTIIEPSKKKVLKPVKKGKNWYGTKKAR